MRKTFFLVCISILMSEITFSSPTDSIITTNKVGIIKKIKETNEYIYPVLSRNADVFIKINEGGVYSEREQVILKVNNNVYIRFDGTGFLYHLVDLNDSIATFKKIDRTSNINYCIGSFNFITDKDIFNYGGYGFWKNNGLIRKYDAKSKEWSVIKTNQEIPEQLFNINSAWFDVKNNRIYTPFRFDVHAALKENVYQYGKITPAAYAFDFKTTNWSVLGNTSESALELLKEATLFLSTARGLMILSYEQLYLLDFEQNKIFKQHDNVFAQQYMRITDKNSVFHLNKTLYAGERETGKLDSVHLDLDSFDFTGNKIYEPIKDYTWLWIMSGIILLIVIFMIIVWFIKRRAAKIVASKSELKNFKFEFNDIEKGLIQMLLDKSKSNQTSSINDINYVLGVKDKNIGLQKKVRSEVFNAVNEKFKLISDWDEPLIQSIRSESDKRYFEYMIRKDMIKEAEKVLQN